MRICLYVEEEPVTFGEHFSVSRSRAWACYESRARSRTGVSHPRSYGAGRGAFSASGKRRCVEALSGGA